MKNYNRYIFILSLLGVIVSSYVLQGFLRGKAIVCVNTGCELVRKNPASYILGIPVPAFGFAGYICLTILAFFRTIKEKKWQLPLMLGITIFGVLFITWFTLTEIFVIHGMCTWCGVSGIIMFAVFALTLKSFLLSKKNYGRK
jgi:uncharacterized membrane protein